MATRPLLTVLLLCMMTVVSSNVSKDFLDEVCDPHTITSGHYPSLIMRLSVEKTSPLKLKATYRLPNSTKEFSFEGMVYTGGFSTPAATAACRSLGCSRSAGYSSMTWTTGPTCEFTCPDGTSAKQTCRYMIQDFVCASDAMSLLECLTSETFWYYASYTPSSTYQGIDLKCTACED